MMKNEITDHEIIASYQRLPFAKRNIQLNRLCKHVSNLQKKEGDRDFHKSFETRGQLGSGAFGTVHLCISRALTTPCAVKIIEKKSILQHPNRDKLCVLLKGEILSLRALRGPTQHRNLTRVVGLYEDEDKYYFVMELITGGTLLKLLEMQKPNVNSSSRQRKLVQEREHKIWEIVKQLLQALAHLHAMGICHRDIKLENVMLDSEPNGQKNCVKLTDFGFATFFASDTTTVRYVVGTPEYMAPEVVTRG